MKFVSCINITIEGIIWKGSGSPGYYISDFYSNVNIVGENLDSVFMKIYYQELRFSTLLILQFKIVYFMIQQDKLFYY